MAERRVRAAAWHALVVIAPWLVLASGAGDGAGAVQPDPGNAAAWASGLALLADPPGPLAVFDQPGAIATGPGSGFAFAIARARPFGFDPLARTRFALAARRGRIVVALGGESYGPPGARRSRLGAGGSWQRTTPQPGLAVGAAWHEARLSTSGATSGLAPPPRRSGALDVGVVLARGRLGGAVAVRSLWAGGAAAARADADWTAEGRLDVAPARLHVALTHDLAGTRLGGGMAFASGPVIVRAGAFGAPWTWALGLGFGGPGRLRGALARTVHPTLGPSDAWQGDVAW